MQPQRGCCKSGSCIRPRQHFLIKRGAESSIKGSSLLQTSFGMVLCGRCHPSHQQNASRYSLFQVKQCRNLKSFLPNLSPLSNCSVALSEINLWNKTHKFHLVCRLNAGYIGLDNTPLISLWLSFKWMLCWAPDCDEGDLLWWLTSVVISCLMAFKVDPLWDDPLNIMADSFVLQLLREMNLGLH